ncbi:hypothetical protein PQR05_26625, partial [Paraburkholderia sediminicola]|uniref:hypothetical protein n=1 Tax=Paraburkholderia sediminicola TaxID=458836 RepID=UPI0038BA3668
MGFLLWRGLVFLFWGLMRWRLFLIALRAVFLGLCFLWGCLSVGCLPSRRWFYVCLRCWPFVDFFACSARFLYAFGVGLSLILLFLLFAFGVWPFLALDFGLSLKSYWFISVAPVRGGHLLFFACRK